MGARRASSQESVIDRLSLDRLQVVSVGLGVGRILPSQLLATKIFIVSADYGEFAPHWRLIGTASYWRSRYRDGVVQAFVDSLNARLSGGGTARVVASPISLYDVTFGAEARYTVPYSGDLKPFLGLGLAAHVINAEGKLIDGTFIERSLDNVATGAYVTAGVSLKLVSHLGVEGSVRGDLLSGFRSSQVRAGGTYFFGQVRGTKPVGDSPP
jgi:hypothetical protein